MKIEIGRRYIIDCLWLDVWKFVETASPAYWKSIGFNRKINTIIHMVNLIREEIWDLCDE